MPPKPEVTIHPQHPTPTSPLPWLDTSPRPSPRATSTSTWRAKTQQGPRLGCLPCPGTINWPPTPIGGPTKEGAIVPWPTLVGPMGRTSFGEVGPNGPLPKPSRCGRWRRGGITIIRIHVVMGRIVGITPKLCGGIQRELVVLKLFVMVVVVFSSLVTMIHRATILAQDLTNYVDRVNPC